MSLFDILNVTDLYDPLVEKKFKELMIAAIQGYRTNPTRKKCAHIILNLPMGAFLKEKDVTDFIFENNRTIKLKELINFILAEKPVNIIERRMSHESGTRVNKLVSGSKGSIPEISGKIDTYCRYGKRSKTQ